MEWLALQRRFPPEYGVWTGHPVGRALVLRGEVDVPSIPKRRSVAICFWDAPSRSRPVVMVSGPARSRHRFRHFRPTSLCLYYGPDPDSMKWTLNDGLVGLIDLIREHLFKEEWWRTTGIWPGPEVHLDPQTRPGQTPPSERPAAKLRRQRQRCWCGAARYDICHGAMTNADELRALGLPRAHQATAAQ